jgi:hypothetical protein
VKADSLPPDIWNGARPEKWRRLHPQESLKLGVGAGGGLENHLPLLAGPELALVPEDACKRPGDLRAGRQLGLDGPLSQLQRRRLRRSRNLYLPLAIDADPVLGTRLDTMVGTEFSLQQRRLDWLLVEHLLEPMIVTSRAYEFDDAVFELHYNRLEAGLLADTVRFVEFVPLTGFTSSMAEIALLDGVVLRPDDRPPDESGHPGPRGTGRVQWRPQ